MGFCLQMPVVSLNSADCVQLLLLFASFSRLLQWDNNIVQCDLEVSSVILLVKKSIQCLVHKKLSTSASYQGACVFRTL